MERKNMVLLTVIAVATLLVAVVGATFAYFTASTTTTGSGNSTNVTTNKFDGATLTFKEAGKVFDMLDYPGGLGIYGATATIAKQDDNGDDPNNYKATFDLEITYTNLTGTDLEWELWMLSKKIEELPFEGEEGGFAKITKCERKEKTNGTTTYYWYADHEDSSEDYTSGQCDAENIKDEVTEQGGTLIAHGKFKSGQSDKKIDKTTQTTEEEIQFGVEDPNSITKNQLGDRTLNTVDTQSKVYYLVVKYPNSGDQSENDAGKTIKVGLAVNADTANSTIYDPE